MKIKTTLLLLSGVTLATQAAAFDGQITFEGAISDVTCIVTGGEDGGAESASSNFTINLPPVSTTALAASGQRAGDTKFYLKLSGANCADGKTANVIFEKAQSEIDSATGNLTNLIPKQDGGSENVQVALLNKDKTTLDLNKSNASHQPVVIANNTARFDYWAQYYATGQATAGEVRSLVTYSISYK